MRRKSRIIILIIVSVCFVIAAGCESVGGEGDGTGLSWLTVGDRVIGEIEARYFLYSSAHVMRTHLPYIGWGDVIDGIPVPDYIKNEAVSAMKLYYVTHLKADELSVGLAAEQTAVLDMWRDSYIDHFGDEDAFMAFLEDEGITDEMFTYFNETTLLRANIKESLFGEDGSMRASTEQLIAYAADNGRQNGIIDFESFRDAHAEEELGKLFEQWSEDVAVTISDQFKNIDVKELYENFR